jgi:hypothetical protein
MENPIGLPQARRRHGTFAPAASPNKFEGFAMSTQQKDTRLEDAAGPHPARTQDNLIGGDDIGLPSGIQPEEVGKVDEIKPDPDKVESKTDKSGDRSRS